MPVSTSVKRLTVVSVVSVAAVAASVVPAVAAPAGPPSTSDSVPGSTARPGALGPLGPLVDLAIQRLFVSDQVAAAKFGTTQPIDDPAREQQELNEVRHAATELGIDPEATAAFFADQIAASKVVQKGLFELWTARPELAPVSKPDLTQIREELDQLTTEILGQLVATDRLRQQPVACRVGLATAAVSGAAVNHLDRLHRQALAVAVRSSC
ncbi:gamma subclass chorismate mutase AroQ [Amycolatopsis acidiphila]|uniref:chorismate mutase n=1 Tax=Amycolatopsis acidiphila TaxID=715473 RepID=A0A558AFD3_9PSEU|nr:gamma subclass chorismate mutase AroQ [Amycolatopsis acidiphila]TVT22970.1 gamma subclass chorismate mutase AroQ [Amycolatopsis acidiphila]UIJ57131.1 gamma subclass chorismate mutase AroQ [Amycolatopsis acidiphila]GHG53178.1 hypothetical protein GCM10017788_01700 [Amycolatopsis acidiphila]